jgi:hypothetical protein
MNNLRHLLPQIIIGGGASRSPVRFSMAHGSSAGIAVG